MITENLLIFQQNKRAAQKAALRQFTHLLNDILYRMVKLFTGLLDDGFGIVNVYGVLTGYRKKGS